MVSAYEEEVLDEYGEPWEMEGAIAVSAIWTLIIIWFSALQKLKENLIRNTSEKSSIKWKETGCMSVNKWWR